MEFKVRSHQQFWEKLTNISFLANITHPKVNHVHNNGYYTITIPDEYVEQLKTNNLELFEELNSLNIG